MKSLICAFSIVASLVGSGAALGSDAYPDRSKKFGFAGDMDLEFGGDEVATVYFTNNTDQSVNAGQGVTLSAGMHFRPGDRAVDIKATVGYKFVTTQASNADIGISRFVIKASLIYDPYGTWWAGIGPVLHSNVKFDGDGFTQDIKFDDAFGVNVQAGWKWFALTYTNMDYKFRSATVDASSYGLSLIYRY